MSAMNLGACGDLLEVWSEKLFEGHVAIAILIHLAKQKGFLANPLNAFNNPLTGLSKPLKSL